MQPGAGKEGMGVEGKAVRNPLEMAGANSEEGLAGTGAGVCLCNLITPF